MMYVLLAANGDSGIDLAEVFFRIVSLIPFNYAGIYKMSTVFDREGSKDHTILTSVKALSFFQLGVSAFATSIHFGNHMPAQCRIELGKAVNCPCGYKLTTAVRHGPSIQLGVLYNHDPSGGFGEQKHVLG